MKALVVEKAANRSLQDLNFAAVPVPTPAEHEVLIKVHAAGLNPVDYKIVEGGVSAWQYPHVLGLDVAGEIVSVGQGVTNWHVGDRVSGHGDLTKNGCFAEYVTAPTYELAKIPDSDSYEVAASALCGALTAYEAIERKANLPMLIPCWFMLVRVALAVSLFNLLNFMAVRYLQLFHLVNVTT